MKIPRLPDKHSTLKTKACPREGWSQGRNSSSPRARPPEGPSTRHSAASLLPPCTPGKQGWLPGREPGFGDGGHHSFKTGLPTSAGRGEGERKEKLLAMPPTCLKHHTLQGQTVRWQDARWRGRPALLTRPPGKPPPPHSPLHCHSQGFMLERGAEGTLPWETCTSPSLGPAGWGLTQMATPIK